MGSDSTLGEQHRGEDPEVAIEVQPPARRGGRIALHGRADLLNESVTVTVAALERLSEGTCRWQYLSADLLLQPVSRALLGEPARDLVGAVDRVEEALAVLSEPLLEMAVPCQQPPRVPQRREHGREAEVGLVKERLSAHDQLVDGSDRVYQERCGVGEMRSGSAELVQALGDVAGGDRQVVVVGQNGQVLGEAERHAGKRTVRTGSRRTGRDLACLLAERDSYSDEARPGAGVPRRGPRAGRVQPRAPSSVRVTVGSRRGGRGHERRRRVARHT
jgi:hypothetical protein